MLKSKRAYYVVTGLFSLMMLGGAGMYFADYPMVSEMFASLGYPTHIIYPLAVAKILGVVAIVSRKSLLLKDLAYAGFFYDLVLAVVAHLVAQDGEFAGALVALILVVTSFSMQRAGALDD